MLDVKKYVRKPFEVQAVQVTAENIYEVAKWCQGDLVTEGAEQFIKVRVTRVINERQTQAFVTDWVLYAGTGYKVYTAKAFSKSFDEPDQKAAVDTGPLSAADFSNAS